VRPKTKTGRKHRRAGRSCGCARGPAAHGNPRRNQGAAALAALGQDWSGLPPGAPQFWGTIIWWLRTVPWPNHAETFAKQSVNALHAAVAARPTVRRITVSSIEPRSGGPGKGSEFVGSCRVSVCAAAIARSAGASRQAARRSRARRGRASPRPPPRVNAPGTHQSHASSWTDRAR